MVVACWRVKGVGGDGDGSGGDVGGDGCRCGLRSLKTGNNLSDIIKKKKKIGTNDIENLPTAQEMTPRDVISWAIF